MPRQLKDKVLGYLKSAKVAKRQGPRIFEECQGNFSCHNEYFSVSVP